MGPGKGGFPLPTQWFSGSVLVFPRGVLPGQAVAIIPFALKPLVALMSDAFPIGGYHKLPYVVGSLGVLVERM